MTINYEEEQRQELESLAYIYTPEELIVDQSKVSITITLESQTQFTLSFILPLQYPDDIPNISIHGDLHTDDCSKLLLECKQAAVDSIGMGSIYSVSSHAKDWAEDLVVARRKNMEDAEYERKQLEEELEAEKYRGTRVNAESFKNWKLAFVEDAKSALKNGEKLSLAFQAAIAVDKLERKIVDKEKKLTGRLMFESNVKLIESDNYANEDGEDVDYSKYERGVRHDEDEDDNEVIMSFEDERE